MASVQRIALVANTSWSVYKFRLYILAELVKKGFHVYVLAPRDHYTEQFENLPGLTFIELHHFRAKSISPLQDLWLRRELTRHYRSIRPNLIFHYTIKANVFGSMAARRARIPSVSVVTGLGYTFTSGGWVRKAASILYRKAWRRDMEVWVLNEDDRDLLTSLRLAGPGKIRVLPGEGVDTGVFYPAPFDPSSNKPVTFLFIGRMIRPKGIVEFAEAARTMQQRGLPARFQALGFFDDNPDSIPRRQVEEWAGKGILTWLGQTDDVIPFIEKADCIVLPSYREGMPMSLLEGASMCKALIAGDSPGCRTLVQDGVNGFLCRTKDSADLAAKMTAYLELPPTAKRQMGIAGRERLMSGYTRKQILDVYMEKINGLPPAV